MFIDINFLLTIACGFIFFVVFTIIVFIIIVFIIIVFMIIIFRPNFLFFSTVAIIFVAKNIEL